MQTLQPDSSQISEYCTCFALCFVPHEIDLVGKNSINNQSVIWSVINRGTYARSSQQSSIHKGNRVPLSPSIKNNQ